MVQVRYRPNAKTLQLATLFTVPRMCHKPFRLSKARYLRMKMLQKSVYNYL